ncbi:hypothetical protein [Haloprofundus sp. MHR1]|uniref:hypothetical protein n=1 Tax=Haloprofundus sp. MHR1 TaxID=2572921 RepID=UPI0010BE8730|nr:hypothetical protein [Haloprofundus sp. MHR1]QCJ45625.1 hypothetical protein FCF25_00095 [Haloprofundus sp. MHR1]
MTPPTPLFGALPGGPELTIILLILVIPIGAGLFVYSDAKRNGLDYAPAWALGVTALFFAGFLPGIPAFLAYVYVREKQARDASPRPGAESE